MVYVRCCLFSAYSPVPFRYPDRLIYARLFPEPSLVYQLMCASSSLGLASYSFAVKAVGAIGSFGGGGIQVWLVG
jgi:hypothetical protein